MKTTLIVSVKWEAAHQLDRALGPKHKCGRVHGHGYRLEVAFSGPVNSRGILTDTGALKAVIRRRIVDRLDHRMMNEDPWFDEIDPTAEYLAARIFEDLAGSMPGVEKVTLWETETGRVEVTA